VEIENLFGLPAHPLIVHAAVVLLPLAALATLVVAALPRARRAYAPLALAAALAATAAVGLAQGSGEALEERVAETDLVEAHTHSAESVLPWAIGVTVAAAAVTATVPLSRRLGARARGGLLSAGLIVLSAVAGVGATWSVVNVGHSGAKAAWDDVAVGSGTGDAGVDQGKDDDAGERDDD